MCRLLNCLLLRLHLISIAAAYSELFSRVSTLPRVSYSSMYIGLCIKRHKFLGLYKCVETLQKCPCFVGTSTNRTKGSSMIHFSLVCLVCERLIVECVPFAVYANYRSGANWVDMKFKFPAIYGEEKKRDCFIC